MEITASMVKELRELTGAGMMDCKKALTETEGDLEQAVDVLRTKGLADLAKKSGRATNEGVIGGSVSADGRIGVLVEINCETDFVARNADFKAFVSQVAEHIAQAAPADVASLLAQPYAARPEITVEQFLGETVGKLGENMGITRFERFELASEAGLQTVYIHGVGNIGVLVELSTGSPDASATGDFVTLAKDIAMQIAAAAPVSVDRSEVPSDMVEHARAIYMAQAAETGKPEQIQAKIAEGRLEKFYKESVLLEQEFVKDPDITIAKLIKDAAAALGTDIAVTRFARLTLGETAAGENDTPAC